MFDRYYHANEALVPFRPKGFAHFCLCCNAAVLACPMLLYGKERATYSLSLHAAFSHVYTSLSVFFVRVSHYVRVFFLLFRAVTIYNLETHTEACEIKPFVVDNRLMQNHARMQNITFGISSQIGVMNYKFA